MKYLLDELRDRNVENLAIKMLLLYRIFHIEGAARKRTLSTLNKIMRCGW